MRQHIRPHRFESRTMREQGLKRGNRKRFVSAFLPEYIEQYGRCWSAIRVPVKVHHVIQIARPRPFGECPKLFPEGFLVGVAVGPNSSLRPVTVGMKYFASHSRKHHPLIRREV